MEDNSKKSDGTSRREVLKLGAYGLGAIAMSGGANAQTKKASQSSVHYQSSPKSGKQCSMCRHFSPPSSCKVVDGTISPSGYCILFAKA